MKYNYRIEIAHSHSLGRAKLRRAIHANRVCRAWHLTSQVKVLIPGIRRAEG